MKTYTASSVDGVFIGNLKCETIINKNNQIFINQPGGDLLYTSYSFRLRGFRPGLISCVGEDYPDE